MISRASEYAIRALTYLAQKHDEPGYVLVREMATRLGVPAPFLAKVLQPLVAADLIRSQRGRSGGFRLAEKKEPMDISLYEIVNAEERLGHVRKCLLGQSECTDDRACPLHQYWKRTSGEYMTLLASTSLHEMADFGARKSESGYPFPLPTLGQ